MNVEEINKRFNEIIDTKNKKPRSNFIFLFTLIIIIIILLLFIWKYYSKKINNISNIEAKSSTSDRNWLN